jgi:hypothetical protein
MTAARKLAAVPPVRKRKPAAITPHEAEVERAIAELDPDHIQCRDTGHTWRRRNAKWITADNCWEQTLVCEHCETERMRYLSARGAILDSRYAYAAGYVMPRGVGRLSSSDRDGIRLRGLKE